MENFNNSFSEIIFEIVYSVLDYCDNSVEKLFIHCANEENCISSNIFFQKNGKKIKGSQLNCISEHSQKEIIHIVNEKIKDLRNLCLNNNKEVPTEMKLIYETANKQLISDFYYEKLFSNSENVLIQDIFDNWFISQIEVVLLNFASLQIEEHKNDTYFDLLIFREKVIQNILKIEKDIKMKSKFIHAKPSILDAYSNDLELLSLLSTLIREKFEIQYVNERKLPENYYEDMCYFYKVYIPMQKSKNRKERMKNI